MLKLSLNKAFILLCTLASSSALADLASDATPFTLKRVTDGDTIVTSDDTRIRLWGIDTPERDQPYGGKATEALKSLLRWEKLYLETKNVDRYGRTVGVIYTADGEEINLMMVCDGHAWWYQRYAKRAHDYKDCQEEAQENQLGLWAEEEPVAPWDWSRR